MDLSRRIIFLLAFFLSTNLFAQTYFKFAIYFTNKSPVGYPYSLSTPQDFLSQRSIDRRTIQNIALDSLDLPVAPSYIQGVLAISDSISYFNKSKWMNCLVIGMSDSTLIDS